MGNNETGKTTLIAKLQGVEDPKKGSALEYAYIDVRDEYRDGEFTLLLTSNFHQSKVNIVQSILNFKWDEGHICKQMCYSIHNLTNCE